MKILLISWLLLVLGVSLNSGHYIYKVEKENGRSYEVKSNPRGLVLVNSKLESPTLMDILFHDLIERFYGKEEPLITERAFTNSHGLPFLEELDDGGYEESMRPGDDEEDEKPEPKPLTDEAVKEAYKSKSYLFDQMRQRHDDISPDLLERKKRQADMQYFPDAPQIPSDYSSQYQYAPPKTYGMNLSPGGGYVWNNLNNPSSMYELGQPSNGYQNPDQSEIPQPEDSTSAAPEIIPPEEFTPPAPGTSNSGSSEDIYVNTNKPAEQAAGSDSSEDIFVDIDKPKAQPLEIEEIPIEPKEDIPEVEASSTENPIVPNDDSSDGIEPTEPVKEAKTEPEGRAIEIPETPLETLKPNSEESKPVEGLEPAPVQENPEEPEELPAETSSVVAAEETAVTTEGLAGNSEADQVRVIPEAPTLPPLNYDNLPDYVRQAISSTERAPITEDVLATAPPVEDIPKTYGMNLTSGSGKVWNDLVNPPVSYEVGSPNSNQSEEPKETTTQSASIEEPVTGVTELPAEPISTEVPAIPEGTVATEQTENPPDVTTIQPPEYEPDNEEAKATTELPELTSTSETPKITESTEPDVKLPETEPENEDIKATTELPELTSTSETPEITESTEPDVKLPNTEANNEENNPSTEIPEFTSTTQILDTVAPITEPATETNTNLPEIITIISTTVEPESISEENKPSDDNIEPVEPVTPAEDPEVPEVEPESGSGELSEEIEDKVAEPEEEKPDIMNELLKSEQFWKWLGEWAATYTELMEKHIRKIAIQEICNYARQGGDMRCPLDEPEDSGSIIKDGKVSIKGTEIDLRDNFNQLKRGSADKGNKIDATTIYGNSVGNDKVTNVFIFNPNNAKDILEGLKPDNDKVNIIIEEHNKEEAKDKNEEIAEAEVTEIPELNDSTEDSGIEDRKAEIPKVEDIEAVTEMKPTGDGNKDEIITENVKDVERVTEVVELKDETTVIADVKEVTTVASELAKDN